MNDEPLSMRMVFLVAILDVEYEWAIGGAERRGIARLAKNLMRMGDVPFSQQVELSERFEVIEAMLEMIGEGIA